MPKILLIYPYFLEDRINMAEISNPPLGLYYIAAVLKANRYDVEILNWYNIQQNPQTIVEVLKAKKPDIIGFSILNANRWGGIEIAKIAKQHFPYVKIVFGGIGASSIWKHFLTHFSVIDYIVIGEGEYSFLNLVQHIEKNKEPIAKIKGLAYRQHNQIIKNDPVDLIANLDGLPNPAQFYAYQHLSFTRGCPANCTFCGSPDYWRRKVRFHSPDYFVDQLEMLCQQGIRFFYFSDDTFTMNKNKVIAVCQKIIAKKLSITWQAISRVNLINEEILYWMRKAGCIQISFGVESGSEKIRQTLNKNINTGQIEQAFSLTTKYGILSRAYMIYGCPGESWDTIQETIDLMHQIKPLSTIFYILDIFPGTALYEDYKIRMKVNDDVWLNKIEDIMYFETNPNFSQEQILAFGKKLRTTFYEQISSYVEALDLVDIEELYPYHADFLSRLAMSFDQGDYSKIDLIKDKIIIAKKLYKRALTYYHDHWAYLGLGMVYQKTGQFDKSNDILEKGQQYYPKSEQLSICLGINYMNLGQFQTALNHFLPFQNSKQAQHFINICNQQ